MTLKAVAFDLDGLMFNTEDLYQEVGAELLRRRGHIWSTELLDQMMGRPGRVALQIMIDFHDLDSTVDELQAETDAIFPSVLDQKLAPMPGLLALLNWLEDRNVPKAVTTSSRRVFVDDVLRRYDLADRFSFILSAENVTNGKPDPEIYLTAAARFDIEPRELLVLEDSENGCRAAVQSGAYAIAIPGGHSVNHDFAGAKSIENSLESPRILKALSDNPPATR